MIFFFLQITFNAQNLKKSSINSFQSKQNRKSNPFILKSPSRQLLCKKFKAISRKVIPKMLMPPEYEICRLQFLNHRQNIRKLHLAFSFS